MKKSAFISDVIFTFLVSGIFTLCLFRALSLALPLALFLSVVCGALAACGVGALLQSKRKSLHLKRSEETQKHKFLEHLCLLSDEQKTEYLQAAISKLTDRQVRKSGKLRLFDEENFYFLKFRYAPVTADEVASAARWKTNKKKVLLCNRIDEGAALLCSQLDLDLKTGERVYAEVKTADALPSAYLSEEKKEIARKRRKKLWFSRRNFKGFFMSGMLLLFSSLLTPFPTYYLIFGALLLLAAILVRIFGYE